MPERYSIAFTSAGRAYVRQALGARPFDEVWMLIQSIEQQRREQDQPAPPPPPPGAEDLPDEAGAPALKVV